YGLIPQNASNQLEVFMWRGFCEFRVSGYFNRTSTSRGSKRSLSAVANSLHRRTVAEPDCGIPESRKEKTTRSYLSKTSQATGFSMESSLMKNVIRSGRLELSGPTPYTNPSGARTAPAVWSAAITPGTFMDKGAGLGGRSTDTLPAGYISAPNARPAAHISR